MAMESTSSVAPVVLHDVHIHTINIIGATFFVGTLLAHLPTLAWYTAAVGAVWYTLLAVRTVIQSVNDVRQWLERRKKSS
jgi:hypothetical protein